MRQPARQLSDGFHFLAVQQRLLQPLTLNAVDLHLGSFLFQQTRGVLKRGGVAGKNVERTRQLSQLIAPLQGGDGDILFAVSQTRHRPGNRRQVGGQIAVDIPAGAPGDDQRQHGEDANKHADGLQFMMALGRAKPGGLRDLFYILIDVAVEDRHQRLDVKHIPVDRQIALFQLRRQRGEPAQLIVEIGQHNVHDRLRCASRQGRGDGVQLLYRGARRGGVDGGDNQPVHFRKLLRVRYVAAKPPVNVLQVA